LAVRFRRRQKDERKFKIETLGSLIIEKTQSPNSLHTIDGSVYEHMTYTFRLRVSDGPILFERYYVVGEREHLDAMREYGIARFAEEAENDYIALNLFYTDLYKHWNLV
jgi:hypothetical protein